MADIITPTFGSPNVEEPAAPREWVCNCACVTFNLLETGEARCAGCGETTRHAGGGWLEDIEQSGEWEGPPPPMSDASFVGGGGSGVAKRRVVERAKDDDVAVLVVVADGGATQVWTRIATFEQADWGADKLRDAENLIRRGVAAHQKDAGDDG